MELNTTHKETTELSPSRREIWHMFDRIASRYDLLNHLLSLGQDIIWRRKVCRFLPSKSNLSVLDIATGTGDQLITLINHSDKISSAVGIDMAKNMLHVAEQKIVRLGLNAIMSVREGNVANLDFDDECFDIVTITFGIRNFEDLDQSLREIYRVLKPKGRLIILEFSLPRNLFVKKLYLFYFRKILPVIGAIISGDHYAYRYLNKTVETFPSGKEFREFLPEKGFLATEVFPLTLGIATIYYADKP